MAQYHCGELSMAQSIASPIFLVVCMDPVMSLFKLLLPVLMLLVVFEFQLVLLLFKFRKQHADLMLIV